LLAMPFNLVEKVENAISALSSIPNILEKRTAKQKHNEYFKVIVAVCKSKKAAARIWKAT